MLPNQMFILEISSRAVLEITYKNMPSNEQCPRLLPVEYSVQFKIICLAIFTIKSLQSSYLYIVET